MLSPAVASPLPLLCTSFTLCALKPGSAAFVHPQLVAPNAACFLHVAQKLHLLSIYSSSLFFLTFCPACPAPLASLSDMHLSHCYTACSFALVISPALSACDCCFVSWQASFSLPIALKTPLACKLAAVMHLAFYHFP